jgi:hypothetical protein
MVHKIFKRDLWFIRINNNNSGSRSNDLTTLKDPPKHHLGYGELTPIKAFYCNI